MNAPDYPSENLPDKDLEQRARQLYRHAAQRLDPHTAGRLRAARHEALRITEARPFRAVRWLIPTGAFAIIALASLMMWQPQQQHTVPLSMHGSGSSAAELDSELPPDADQADPTMYQNLDFYGWLAANDSSTVAQ